jgi:flagellin
MALSILSNIPSLEAQNQLGVTNANLQNTLFQLSSGSKINSGADDPAGMSIANGLQANISALTQSAQNVTTGVGQLQVADGALSQVTTLLNRAVTLATEAANGGLTADQFAAITNEYQSITAEIDQIGQATDFNGTGVFSSATVANPNQVTSAAISNVGVNEALTAGATTTVQLGNNPAYTYTAGASATTLLGTGTVTSYSTIGNGQTINVTDTGGTVAFTAGPLSYTGATTMTGGEAATLNGVNPDGLTIINAKGTTTYAGSAGQTIGAWLTQFNAQGAANGVSAYLSATNKLVIQSTTGITSVATAGGFTTDFGALSAPTITEEYTGATAMGSGLSTALNGAVADGLTVTNANGSAVYTGVAGAQTVGQWITAFNAIGNPLGITASLNSSNKLQIVSTAPITAAPTAAGDFTNDFGALSGTTTTSTDTVGDLMNQINTSGYGMTASINSNGNFEVTSSNGAISVTNNNANVLGTVAATNTVQDLIDGINASGLGVTAGIVKNVTNPNRLQGATALTTSGAATPITDGETLTITSGTETDGDYANTFTYTATAGTAGSIADPVAGTQGNDTVQGLIDAINNSGKPFHAFLDAGNHLQITDSSYSGNLAASGTVATGSTGGVGAVTGAFSSPTVNQLEITDPENRGDLAVTNNDPVLGFVANGNPLEGGNADSFVAPQMTGSGGAHVFISDGQVALNNTTIAVPIGLLSSSQIGSNTTSLGEQNLGTASGAASALTVINSAISDVAAMRGTIGAGINRLTSATNVINTQVQNLTSAQSSIQDANIGQVIANMSKYQILEQTGIAALAQSNTSEQAILRLLP